MFLTRLACTCQNAACFLISFSPHATRGCEIAVVTGGYQPSCGQSGISEAEFKSETLPTLTDPFPSFGHW